MIVLLLIKQKNTEKKRKQTSNMKNSNNPLKVPQQNLF